MRRVGVISSNLLSVGYDADSQTLEIEFKSRSVYQYNNVPSEVYEALMAASSHGVFFNREVKDLYNTYRIR